MVAKHKMEKANRIAKALLKAGWHANVTTCNDGVPILYVRGCGFEKLLLEAVDDGLSSLCGSSKQVIYSLLEKTFNIKRQEIPSKIEEFADAIEKIFGFGAKPIETLIMERLNEKVGLVIKYRQELRELVFTEYIMAARQSFWKKENKFMRAQHSHVRKRLWDQTKEKSKQN